MEAGAPHQWPPSCLRVDKLPLRGAAISISGMRQPASQQRLPQGEGATTVFAFVLENALGSFLTQSKKKAANHRVYFGQSKTRQSRLIVSAQSDRMKTKQSQCINADLQSEIWPPKG